MSKNDKFHIFLVTTKGCARCKIMDKILRKVLDKTTNITYHVYNYTKKKKLDRFKDFPTVLLVDDGEIKARIVGTEPECYVINKIRQAFGNKVFKPMI